MTQTYPTNWDVEKYRDETDPDEHWLLRKKFMEAHKGKFSEDYLVALAKAFTNIEFMGCSYPEGLMRRISELSSDVAKDYREIKKTKLQRTFVAASSAAEDKISVANLKVVNDTAERAINLMEKYNETLTKDEEQKQLILRLVHRHRKQLPTPSKAVLNNNFTFD